MYSSEVLQGDIIQIQQRGFHSGRHISEGWDLDLGAKYHILILLDNQDLLKLFSVTRHWPRHYSSISMVVCVNIFISHLSPCVLMVVWKCSRVIKTELKWQTVFWIWFIVFWKNQWRQHFVVLHWVTEKLLSVSDQLQNFIRVVQFNMGSHQSLTWQLKNKCVYKRALLNAINTIITSSKDGKYLPVCDLDVETDIISYY